MSDVTVIFSVGGKNVGIIKSSLECFDSSRHLIPKRIINKITNTNSQVEISFQIEHTTNNT